MRNGCDEPRKESIMAKKITKKVTVNNATTNIKEESIMMKRLEELVAQVTENKRIQDTGYIKKDALKAILNKEFGLTFNKKSTRDEMVTTLMAMYKDSIRVADEIAYGNVQADESVSVGDLEITRDNAPVVNEVKVTPVDNRNAALAKTDVLLGLLKKYAAYNESRDYGYTISSVMLQAIILEAGTGLKKFKGHKMTEDDLALIRKVYNWLIKKEFIKPVMWSVKEDPNVRVYMSDYTGRTVSDKTKLIPWIHSVGYTADKITSFIVTLR